MPGFTILCNLDAGDHGKLARTSAYALDTELTRVKLLFGSKKVLLSANRAMDGIVAGGGRIDKPSLKASRTVNTRLAKGAWQPY